MAHYDVIVAGVGAMGAQTVYQLATRGKRVLGLDRFEIGNGMGSSHGEHRIIRLAYFEHPLYVPILKRAYELWRDLERAAGEQLLFITGSLDIGPKGSNLVEGSLKSSREHGLQYERLSAADVMRRFPGYRLPETFEANLQPDGGFLASERAILAAARLALEAGAHLKGHEPVLEVSPLPGGGVRVRTTKATYEAGALVASSGAWIGELLPSLRDIAVPERQVIGWFRPHRPEQFRLGVFPVSNILSDLGHFYQFPMWTVPGVKIGLYHHLHEHGTAETLSRTVTADDEALLREGLSRFFPEANGCVLAMKTCLFTNTRDGFFIVDRLPGFPEVIVASPCSGHGYKFASAMGESLADLALGEPPRHDLSPFALSRLL